MIQANGKQRQKKKLKQTRKVLLQRLVPISACILLGRRSGLHLIIKVCRVVVPRGGRRRRG